MISREYLHAQRCTLDLIDVLESLDGRAEEVGLVEADEAMVRLLLLLALLSPSTASTGATSDAAAENEAIASDLRKLLRCRAQSAVETSSAAAGARRGMDPWVWGWLDRARGEARFLEQDWLAPDHLRAALLVAEDSRLDAILSARGWSRQTWRAAALNRASRRPPPARLELVEPPERPIAAPRGPRGPRRSLRALLGRPATAVPRRFSLAMSLAVITFYAAVLSLLRLLDAPAGMILFWLVFLTGVALAQPLLFGGREPRAAAILTGALLMPLEIIIAIVIAGIRHQGPGNPMPPTPLIGVAFLSAPLGAVCGYLAGCLSAGLFYLGEQGHALLARRAARRDSPSDARLHAPDPLQPGKPRDDGLR